MAYTRERRPIRYRLSTSMKILHIITMNFNVRPSFEIRVIKLANHQLIMVESRF